MHKSNIFIDQPITNCACRYRNTVNPVPACVLHSAHGMEHCKCCTHIVLTLSVCSRTLWNSLHTCAYLQQNIVSPVFACVPQYMPWNKQGRCNINTLKQKGYNKCDLASCYLQFTTRPLHYINASLALCLPSAKNCKCTLCYQHCVQWNIMKLHTHLKFW